ncbi:hypothetical protein [Escherichia coli]|uniref:hypothetical protein n=1 Tax=Escherichia coli TaxID=562 RepID=UPI00201B1B20|nr:hypothetical protein [Escherichia coli]
MAWTRAPSRSTAFRGPAPANIQDRQDTEPAASDNSSVICGKELEGGSAVFGQMLIGNAYSTTPVSKVRFTIAQVNNDTKVWADMWMETQMAMGQVQQMAITDNASKNTIQQRLDELKP